MAILFPKFAQRHREPELMDQPGLDPALHAQALRGLARVNRLSGTANNLWKTIRPMAVSSQDRPIRVLDIACGGGDVAIELARRAAAAGIALDVSGCDLSPTAVELATQRAASAGVPVRFFVADAVHQPLDIQVDVVSCSLFLHHLDEEDVVELLRRMRDISSQMVIISDLIRSRWGYILTWCGIRLLSRSHICHIDGPLSVRAAFTTGEILRLAERAGLTPFEISRTWPERFLLTWRRP